MTNVIQVDGKPVVTIKEIAEMFGVTVGAVNSWLLLPNFPQPLTKVGKSRLFNKSDVEAFVDARRSRKSHINKLRPQLASLSDAEFAKVIQLLSHEASARPRKSGKSTAK